MAARSLAARATLALVLMIGFYLLVLVVAALLVFIPYVEMRYANRIHFQLAFFCLAGAGIVLWSAIPKRDKFHVPGLLLDRAEQPRLFTLIDKVADETGQEKPTEVYLIHQVNAWVAQRGGFPGFGGRRVMGLGLPMLQVLTVSELEAVLAHEFGHYHGGDTRLGVFVYQTRSGIERTIQHLASGNGRMSILQKPFLWYGNFFLRLTQEVSRAQELAADALAGRLVGTGPLIEGLKKIDRYSLAFDSYVKKEFLFAITVGVVPPIGEGFRCFLSAPEIRKQMEEKIGDIVEFSKKEVERRNPNAALYDSHPSLPARIAALEALHLSVQPTDDRMAGELLDDAPGMDARLSSAILRPQARASSRPGRWDQVGYGQMVWFRHSLKPYEEAFTGCRIEDFAASRERIERKLSEIQEDQKLQGWNKEPDDRRSDYRWLMACALAVASKSRGFHPYTQPGWSLVMRGPRGDFETFDVVHRMEDGTLTEDAWRERCAELELAGASLADGIAAD